LCDSEVWIRAGCKHSAPCSFGAMGTEVSADVHIKHKQVPVVNHIFVLPYCLET